ncbi:MAG TPA: hypothetical protein VLJ79_24150 [Candidatus Binatia bacterium]|nr:hypothetical protein [Candidatus Binatia bacterium]
MNPKQMARPKALGNTILIAAFVTVLILAQPAVAGPTVTVYKSPT